ncbi:MAG: hypothetical protein ABI408_13240 [Gemmatimonadaceae bacterium]
MKPLIDLPDPFEDAEKPHPLVAEFADGAPSQPFAVRLGELWSDLLRAGGEARDVESPRPSSPTIPILDDVKGILQWD